MKSDRQAERIAAVCAAVGLPGLAPDAAPGAAAVAARDGEASREFCRAGGIADAGAGDGSAAAFGGAPEPLTAARQPDDRPARLACKQSTISGLLGAIHEQCSAMSLSVQAPRTAFNSSWVTLDGGGVAVAGAAVCDAFAAGDGAAPGDGATAGGGAAVGGSAPAVGAAGVCSFAATASTAALQDAERLSCERSKHSNASLPPGSTPAQLAMKSERHAERIALRCSLVGCCARTESTPRTTKTRTTKTRAIETRAINNGKASVERCIARPPLKFHLPKWSKPIQPEFIA